MATSVAIANAGLIKVGEDTISSFTAGTAEANFINSRYDEIRRSLLESHTWNFAVKRVKLAQLSAVPVSEFDFFYALPSDFIRSVLVHDNDAGTGAVLHRVEDNKVACSASEVWLKYIYDVTDPNSMTPLFREALSCKIAMEAAVNLAGSNTLYELMREEFERANRRARSADSMSDFPDRLPVGSWATSRHGRVGGRSWPW